MRMIAAGSTAQVLVAALITLFFMLLVLKLAPYADGADDLLSFLTNLIMLLTLFGGFALITNDSKMSGMTEVEVNQLDAALVIINCGAMIALLVSIVCLHPKARRWINSRCRVGAEGEDMNGAPGGSKKIVPLSGALSTNAESKGLREWNAGAIAVEQKSQKGATL